MLEHLPSIETAKKVSVRRGDDVRVAGMAEFFSVVMGMRGPPNSMRSLAILCVCHTSRTFSSVAETLKIPKSGITRHADVLCQAGLLRRSPDPDSGRSVLMAATPKGRRLVETLAAMFPPARLKTTNSHTDTHDET